MAIIKCKMCGGRRKKQACSLMDHRGKTQSWDYRSIIHIS